MTLEAGDVVLKNHKEEIMGSKSSSMIAQERGFDLNVSLMMDEEELTRRVQKEKKKTMLATLEVRDGGVM